MKSYIIAEIASNWEGSISKAKKLILESKKAGVNAVKFQMWRANDLYSTQNPQWAIIKKTEKQIKLRNSKAPKESTSMTTELIKELISKNRAIEKFSIKKC